MREQNSIAQQTQARPVQPLPQLQKRGFMDAKYNRLFDNAAVRVTFNTLAFALWLVVSVGLLELAVKL